jgi:dihydroneopterin aldolase
MYTVFIQGLVVEGIHGVTHKEKERGQPFRVDITIETNMTPPASDHVDDIVDYRVIKKIAQRMIVEESHELVETIALRIIEEVKNDPRVAHVTVSVAKLEIWDNGTPGITIRL